MGSIIDVHVHIGAASGAEEALRKMDANGIDQAVISPVPDYEDPRGVLDTIEQNSRIAEALRAWPDRFPRGLGVVEARHGEDALGEVERIFEDLGLVGLMFHSDNSGISFDHPNTVAIVERAAKYENAIIMTHVFQHSILQAPFQLMRMADTFPDITFLASNAMMTTTDSSAAMYAAVKCPNIVFDTALTHSHLWPIEKMVKEIGAERLLFGSDSPYYTKCVDKLIIENALISEEDKGRIFAGNARRLFSL